MKVIDKALDKYTQATVYGKDGYQILLSNLLLETIDDTKAEVLKLVEKGWTGDELIKLIKEI